MSVIRPTRRPNDSFDREGGSVLRRWAARAIGGALLAGASWVVYGAISAFFYRGPLTTHAKRTELIVSVAGSGTIENGKGVDIKCRARGWSSILEIVPDGSCVREGDVLVRLGDASLQDAIAGEQAALVKAEAAVIVAKKHSEAAQIAIDGYRDGTYVQQRLQLTRVILRAEQTLASTKSSLLQVQIMFRKGFASQFQMQALERNVEKAGSDLAMAKNKRDVLDEFTRPKVLAELTAKRASAAAQLRSAEGIVRTQSAKIERLQEDLSHCVIRAPRDGMAVYPNRTAPDPIGTNQPAPEIYPGAKVRQFQTLVRLVDLGQMEVKLVLPENKLRQLRHGQRAHVSVLDQELQGEVASIADWPEPALPTGDRFKRGAVFIALDGGGEELKPGMTAEVEILIKCKQNALAIPVICVTGEGKNARVWVKKRRGAEPRKVMLGITDNSWVEIIDGLREDESVLMAPGR